MKIIEWLVEAFFTIKLFLSPVIIGGMIGGYFYLTANTATQEYLAYGIWSLGILLGVLLAWKVKKKQAASDFFGKIIATPDLDKETDLNGDRSKTNNE